MQRWTGVVHDRCSAAVVERLWQDGLLDGVHLDGEAGEAAWRAVSKSAPPLSDGETTFGVGRADGGLSISIETGDIACTDPLAWAVMQGLRVITVTLVDAGASRGSIAADLPPGAAYDTVAGAVADATKPLLLRLTSAPQRPWREPGPALALDTTWRRIDWARDAHDIAALVRAFEPHGGAFTTLHGVRVTLDNAEVLAEGFRLPPGTVVSVGAQGAFVAAGEGAILVRALRDAIGTIEPASIVVGSRLGVDLAAEVETLARRVADLESLISHLQKRFGWDRS